MKDGPEVIDLDDYREDGAGGLTTAGTGRGRFYDEGPRFSPEVLKEAELYVEDDEIKAGGGYRRDEYKVTYWLALDRLIEYEKADRRIKSDKDFWKWFREFRQKGNIGSRYGVNWYDNFKGKVGEKKNYLTDWWKGWGYGNSSWSTSGYSEQDRNLAIALGAVSTTVSVINMTGTRYKVQFAADSNEDPTSYTSFDEKLIVVSPQALLDKTVDQSDGIEITTGYGLHEASHVEYTTGLLDALRKPSVLRPLTVSALLLNILEDLRIERLTSNKFPGFAGYFDKALDYLWPKAAAHQPDTWGPELKDMLTAVILIAKWPEDWEDHARKDAALSVEFDWWHTWAESYRTGARTDLRALLEEAIDRLRQNKQAAKEMDEKSKAEEAAEKAMGNPVKMSDEDFKKFLEELEKQLGNPARIAACPSPHQPGGTPIELTAEQAEQVNKLVQEKLEIKFSQFPDAVFKHPPKFVITRPLEDEESRHSYQSPGHDLVNKMKAAFFFRKQVPVATERMLKTGMVDEEELWRVGAGDWRVFERPNIQTEPEVSVTMLIDVSGSMHGSNIHNAQALATIMLECLRTMKGARVRVRGHTCLDSDVDLYRIWEPGDPMSRLGLLGTVDGGCNYDGYAVEYCAQEMLNDQRPNEQMVLFVLSDGRPNGGGNGYGGRPAMEHVRRVSDHYGKKGVTVIQIAVDPAVGPHDQAVMYANWIPFENAAKLPIQLTQKLIKLFGASN